MARATTATTIALWTVRAPVSTASRARRKPTMAVIVRTLTTGGVSRWFARGRRDDRADPWIADAIRRPPGTLHVVRFAGQADALEFGRSLFRGCRHHGVSCSPQVLPDGDGWKVEYRLFRKADGRDYVRGKKTRGEHLHYDKLKEEDR